jgi:transposase
MAANKPDLSELEELNLKVYTFHKYIGWNYRKIASELGLPKSRVRDVVKRGDE